MRLSLPWACASLFAIGFAGCVRLDEDHCANQAEPGAYCDAQHEMAYCSACISENNGCRPDAPSGPCDATGTLAGTDASTTGTTTSDVSMSASMSSTTMDPTTTMTEPTMTMSTTESMDSSTGDPPPGCGNNITEKDRDENCDGMDMPATECSDVSLEGGMLSCYPMGHELECTYDLSECTGGQQCGNGEAQGSEQCDGDDLNDQTCETISDDFIGGTLTCTEGRYPIGCVFNTTGCELCRDNGEDCEVDGQCCSGNCFTLLNNDECAGL